MIAPSKHAIAYLAGMSLGLALTLPVLAQEETAPPGAREGAQATPSQAGRLEVVTVTARRREERLQDVPIAVSAFSEQDLQNQAAVTSRDLGHSVPNLNYENASGLGTSSKIYIRGVGQEDFTPTRDLGVGVYLDGVYLARVSGASFGLVDIDRFEVLRGPQGTLFGRNSVGGAINISTVKPKMEFEARAQLGAGSYALREYQLTLNAPIRFGGLEDKVAVRANVYGNRDDGWQTNIVDGSDFATRNMLGGRVAIRYLPSDSWTIDITADRLRRREAPPIAKCYYIQPVVPAAQPLLEGLLAVGYDLEAACAASRNSPADRVATNLGGLDYLDQWGASTTVVWHPGSSGPLGDVSIKAIGGWRRQKWSLLFDDDMSAAPLSQEELVDHPNDEKQYSAELQLTGKAVSGRLNYVVGLYYFRETGFFEDDFHFYPGTDFDSGLLPLRTDSKAENYAAYGEVSYDLTKQLTLTVGNRYLHDRKEMSVFDAAFASPPFTANPSKSFVASTPRVNVRYRFSEDLMAYAGYSRGYRSGGFNAFASDPTSAQPFNPEILDEYEVGAKSNWFDRRLQLNLAYYYGNYRDIQLLTFGAIGAIATITNAGKAHIQGVELETKALLPAGLRLEANLGTISARYDRFQNVDPQTGLIVDQSHLRFPNTPSLTFDVALEHKLATAAGDLTSRLMWYQQSKTYYDVPNTPAATQGSYGLLSARVAFELPNRKTQIALWGKNLLDRTYVNTGFSLSFINVDQVYFAPPRTYGFQVTHRFD